MKESSEMISKNILIAEDELITRMDIAEIIKEAQHNVVGEASDGFDCIELCRKHRPDLVIMDIKMPILDGIKASKIIMEENIAGCIVLLTAYNDKEYVEEAKKVGVMNYLIKPIDEKSIIPAIEVALSRNEEMRAMKSEVEKLEKKLEDRKIIEKAKGIIMHREKISEEEAYCMLRNMSMKKRCSLRTLAEIIVKTETVTV
ncbi:ANTAR domain-containing response regulator [Acetoanaerobium noterae]|jgi:response regulator NasT|uniref:ANTAR domain-containing response regulator n=1 Tax=Acetoanaerobium noterae TaxID=745369 RepID=UPI0028AB4CF0|nr:response regulator [Acetoanaerobium noterae]